MRIFSEVISWLLNPLLIPAIAVSLLCLFPVEPDYFEVAKDSFYDYTWSFKWFYIKSFLIFGFGAPALSLVIMSKTGFVSSIQLNEQYERFVPIVLTMLYCGLLLFLFTNMNEQIPVSQHAFAMCYVGIVVSITSFVANFWMKISLHAMGAGMLLGLFFSYYLKHHPVTLLPIYVACILAGLILMARLYLGKHTNVELYTGLVSGSLITFTIDSMYT